MKTSDLFVSWSDYQLLLKAKEAAFNDICSHEFDFKTKEERVALANKYDELKAQVEKAGRLLRPEVGIPCTCIYYSDRSSGFVKEVLSPGRILVQQDGVYSGQKIYTFRRNGHWVEEGTSSRDWGTLCALGYAYNYYDRNFKNPLLHYDKEPYIMAKKTARNIEIAKQVLGEDCEKYYTLVEEPQYEDYDVVACNPNSEDGRVLLGLPSYVLIKDGKGRIAAGKVFEDLLFRPLDELFESLHKTVPEENKKHKVKQVDISAFDISACRNLNDYKNAVRLYLTDMLGASEQVAESLIKKNSATLEGAWEDKLPVKTVATGICYNFL